MATRSVTVGQSLQTAINQAQPGDVLELEAGATFNERTVYPNKQSDIPISIRSSRANELPAGKRVTPEDAGKMPKLLASATDRAFKLASGAHAVELIGLEIMQTNEDVRTILELGDSNQTQLDQIPYGINVERCYIHGLPDKESQRGIALNARAVNILDCYISEIHGIGYDTQAICGWNGIGQYKVINCYLEAAGENVMFGGADPAIPNLVATDVEIRRNTLFKPFAWKVGDAAYKGIHWTVKNLFELKALRKVIVDGNVFDGCWPDAQTGWAILFKVQNQDGGCPGCVTEDIEFTNNIIRNSTNGLNILAYDPYKGSGQLKNVRVANCLWQVDEAWYQGTGEGKLPDGTIAPTGCDGLILEHNTHLQKIGNTMTLYGKPTSRFIVRNNLGAYTGYGIFGSGAREGSQALQMYAPNYVYVGNVLAGPRKNPEGQANDWPPLYPTGNFYPATMAEVKLGADFRLAADSPFKGKVAGTDPGCDMDTLLAAQIGTVPTPTPQPPAPSPDGTKGITITDAQGGIWTIGSTKETLRNNVHMGDGHGTLYKWLGEIVYCFAVDSQWWSWKDKWVLFGAKEPGVTPTPTPPPAEPQYEFKKFRWPTDDAGQDAIEAQAAKDGWADCYVAGNWYRCKRVKR